MTRSYAEIRNAARVRERALFPATRTPTELELQARWFAGDFGRNFVSTAGDKIDIVQFGVWNREAGPDFSDAAIRLNADEPLCGCIEFDLTDHNWETHGHAANPAFENTVLHVFVHASERTFFTRTKSNRAVPQVRVDPSALPENLGARVALARPGRCQAPLKDLPEEHVRSVLDAAAQFRLQKKAAQMRTKIETHGHDEALFQGIAAALGYKENKLPFTLLAQRLSLKSLRADAGHSEALLFGVAGFLQAPDLDVYARSTRKYVRQLWDKWWPHGDALRRLILSSKIWRLSSTRPLNHPQRRVAALAAVVREWPAFQRALHDRTIAPISDFFRALRHPFWNFHYTLTAAEAPGEMALIGESRVADILVNVLFPFWLAHDVAPGDRIQTTLWPEYARLPARLSNRRLETAATRLFGSDPRRALFGRTIAHQQALLQIYEDFCLQDNSDCAQCPFPEQMRKWSDRGERHGR
jgi:hypothetical protein